MASAIEQNSREAVAACGIIRREIASWPGISLDAGPMPDSTEFRFRRKLLGHLYATWGNLAMVDLAFSPATGEALIAAGTVEPHPMFPGLGWVTLPIRQLPDAPKAIALFRKAYDGVGGQLRLV